jgi:hypothetical protein
MFCRKCLKEDPENKINMSIGLEKQCYVCPKCGHIINWNPEEEMIRQ